MKTASPIFILTLLLLPLFGLAQQPHPILNSFEAYKQPNGVLLKWVIMGGGQCQGTAIFRAGDTLAFEQIGHISGICGSTDSDETYTFFDSIPFPNTYNHYRLEMGFQGFTSIVTVFFESFNNGSYSILSDAETDQLRILYSNDSRLNTTLQIFDLSGNLHYLDNSNDSDFELSTLEWRNGVYIFRISGASKSDIHGKFYITGP